MKRKPRVLMIASGQSSHTRLWLKGLSNAGCKVFFPVLRGNDWKELKKIKGVTLLRLSKKMNWWKRLKFVFQLRAIVRDNRIDVVHSHYLTAFGWVGTFFISKPKLVTIWGSDLFVDMKNPLIRLLNQLVLTRADLITVHSEYLKKILVKDFAIKEKKIHKGGFGIDRNIFKPQPKSRELIDEFRLKKKDKIILHLRPMEDLYQPMKVMQAFLLLTKKNKNYKIVMPLYRANESIKQKIEGLVDNARLSNQVIWVPPMSPHKWANLLSSVDVCVSLARSDGMPITLWEAMACGSPPILSRLPVYHGFVKGNENALLVKKSNIKELSQAMNSLLTNDHLRKEIIQKNLEKIKNVGDFENEMKAMKKLYLKLSV